MRSASPSFAIPLLCCCALLAPPALAQCEPAWTSAEPRPPLGGTAHCSTTWDPDGIGPAGTCLVVGGANLTGGTPTPARVAVWNDVQWVALGSGPGTTGEVLALTVWNDQLIAGGTFTGGGANRIAVWDGAAWQPLGGGFPTSVAALTVWNGSLVAAGTDFGLAPVLWTWNGTTWNVLPSPPELDTPSALTVYQGLLCVGGLRVSPLHTVIERWNGTTWATSILGNPIGTGAAIRCFAVRPSLAVGVPDTLYVGGRFSTMGGVAANSIAATSGGASFAWSTVGGNTNIDCTALHARNVGLTGFAVTAGFASPLGVHQYTSSTGTWTHLGTQGVTSLSRLGSNLYATRISVSSACVRWNGSAWANVAGAGLLGEVRALALRGDEVIVGGAFQSTTGTALDRIARWSNAAFQPLGTGMTGTSVDALLGRANGHVVAGGDFVAAGGTPANHIASWDGTGWSALGSGTDQPVLALCELPNGDVVAGGTFATAGGVACNRVARWNGSLWSPIGFGTNGTVRALAVRSDGTMFAGGAFTAAGAVSCSRIAQWNGAAWQPLGSGCNGDVHAIAFRPNGDLVVVGAFTSAGGVAADRCALWNGTSWSATASASGDASPAYSVLVRPDGAVVAGRGFHQPGLAIDSGLSRWDGASWSGFGAGVASSPPGTSVNVRAIVAQPDGEVVVGGNFGVAGGLTSRGLASLIPTCPASATAYGAGCSSTAGVLTITADTLPWIGAAFRTTTTGVAAGSLCLGVIGLAPIVIPLDQLVGGGQPGCTLLATLDILMLLTPGAGTAHSSFALNDDPALLGVPFFQQTIPFEAGGAIRASNGLALVIGTL